MTVDHSPAPALLRFEHVSKRFGGTQAVDDVSLDLHAGEVLALLGENGAGKSTLIKLLAGIYPPDAGDMRFDGQSASIWRSRDPLKQPVAFIHQDLGLVEWMTVAENVAIGMGYVSNRCCLQELSHGRYNGICSYPSQPANQYGAAHDVSGGGMLRQLF
jgi:ABC-type sugar transport system ATPase subunit